MYSEYVVERELAKVEKALGTKLRRYSVGECEDRAGSLSKLVAEVDSRTGLPTEFTRNLIPEEARFIANERILARYDYKYWLRYCNIIRDPASGGGEGRLDLWESQKIVLDRIAKVEEEQYKLREADPEAPVDGILFAVNKARQLGLTRLSRSMGMHRVTLWESQRYMASSVDDDKVLELYNLDKFILDALPWYLRPAIEFDVKQEHLSFGALKSYVLYQMSSQTKGLGQGRQFDFAHLTEVASYPVPEMLEHDFFPALPQGPHTVCILESTPQGRGNWWHEFTESVRRKEKVRWHYVFVPWYAEPKKYRRVPPDSWQPSQLSMLHAKKVFDTSLDYIGKQHYLSKQQLYWYETTRDEYQRAGKLNLFLCNYAATSDESFQHTSTSAFSAELLEKLSLGTKPGVSYSLRKSA